MLKEHPSCSVICPSYERPRDVMQLLQSLNGQLRASDEIVIVDDGSTQENWELLFHAVRESQTSKVLLLRSEHGGVSSARNIGIEQAHNSVLLFIDQDCITSCNWIERMVEVITNTEAVQGNYWSQATFSDLDKQHMLWRKIVSEAKRRNSLSNFGVNTRNFAIRKDTLLEVCGNTPFEVNPNKHGGEDILLGMRILAHGVEIVTVEDAVVLHTGDPHDIRGLMKQKFSHGKSDAFTGVLAQDTFTYSNFIRAVLLPMRHGVHPRIALRLWAAYTVGAAFGVYTMNRK